MAQIMEMKVNTGEGRLSKEERTIERIVGLEDNNTLLPGEKGYRYSGNEYAFFDVYWTKVSEHYLIMQRYRHKNRRARSMAELKPVIGPYPLQILEPETQEEEVDRRCLDLLIKDRNIRNLPEYAFGVLNQGGRIILIT